MDIVSLYTYFSQLFPHYHCFTNHSLEPILL